MSVRCPFSNQDGFFYCADCWRGTDVTVSHCLQNITKTVDGIVKKGSDGRKKDILDAVKLLVRITGRDDLSKIEKGQAITAAKRLSKALKGVELKNPVFLVQMGTVYYNLKRFNRAIKYYDSAIKIDPRNRDAWNNKAISFVRLKKINSALKCYDKALEIDPGYAKAWFNKGKVLYRMNKTVESLRCFEMAHKHDPRNVSALNNMGVALKEMKRFDEAIKCYDKALKIKPGYKWSWHNKGMALAEKGDIRRAVRCFEKALEIDPSYPPAAEAYKWYSEELDNM